MSLWILLQAWLLPVWNPLGPLRLKSSLLSIWVRLCRRNSSTLKAFFQGILWQTDCMHYVVHVINDKRWGDHKGRSRDALLLMLHCLIQWRLIQSSLCCMSSFSEISYNCAYAGIKDHSCNQFACAWNLLTSLGCRSSYENVQTSHRQITQVVLISMCSLRPCKGYVSTTRWTVCKLELNCALNQHELPQQSFDIQISSSRGLAVQPYVSWP